MVPLTLVTSTAIVRERERGTLEQLIVTPIGKASLMLGKLVPFVLVGYVQMSVLLALRVGLIDIPIVGSLPLLYTLALVFIVASLGIGLRDLLGELAALTALAGVLFGVSVRRFPKTLD